MNKNVVITILLIIVLCLGGYLVFDKVIDKDNKVEENIDKDSVNKENANYNLDDSKKIMDIYVYKNSVREIFNGLTSELKLRIAYQNLNYSTYQEKISYDELNNSYKDLFGGEEASKQTFSPTGWCNTYSFNSEQNSYIYSEGQGCGGAPWPVNYSIKSATIKDSKLDIIVYYYLCDWSNNLYASEDNKLANLNPEEITNDNKLTDAALEKYKDRLDTFTFRFEKYNDHYVLKDVFKN